MKINCQLTLLISVICLSFQGLNAQDFLTKLDKNTTTYQKSEIYQKKNFPTKHSLASLDINIFNATLKRKTKGNQQIIKLPNTKGIYSNFTVKETSNFDANLSDKFPMIKSYSAKGIDDPTAVAKISIGTDGFHAVVFSGNEKTLYIDPYSKDNKTVIVYKRNDLEANKDEFNCLVKDAFSRKSSQQNSFYKNANDGNLRTFRLALTCSGEYSQFHLTNQNIASSASDQVKKTAVLSAMNTTMTRVNGIFERDLSVRMVLVGDNDKIIYLDAATDNITDGRPNTMLNEVQVICDTEIGNANYDIGHIFSVGGDGIAGGSVVCRTGKKAQGVTGRSQPIGDAYDIDYVVHEMGHQFGANHTQNNDCNRYNLTAIEPGSGSTIMGYAGICSPNVQGQSDDHFHAISIAEMWSTIQSSANCALLTNTGNASPTANAGADFSIPKSTPFVLKGIATDADGLSGLTYSWDQIDNEIATMPPLPTNSRGPIFRALKPRTTPVRYMPALATVVAGNTSSTWEVLPSVARELNFSFLVRDNHSGGGSTARDNVKISIEDVDAFTVTSQNTAVVLDVGSTQTITWSKGTTNVAPINCQNVNIKLSIDGGVSFPIMIKENTPNDGSENILVPNNLSTTARIMVEAADNIFYNVNATNFTIKPAVSSFILTNTSDDQTGCNSGNKDVSYVLNLDFINNFSETITFTATGFPNGSSVLFNPTSINSDGKVTMTVSNLDNAITNDYEINIKAISATINKDIDVILDLNSAVFNQLTLISPQNGAKDINLFEELKWNADSNATSYQLEISTDINFTEIISSDNVLINSYTPTNLSKETTFFWRIKPLNSCNDGSFSEIFSFTTESCEVCTSYGNSTYLTSTTLVQFNTIDNVSKKNVATNGYGDFKSIETTVQTNSTYNLTVNTNTDGNFRAQTKAWIDWNQNCIFDLEEEYDLGLSENGEDIATSLSPFKIKVPADARIGKTILRVTTRYTDPDTITYPTSCDIDFDGEVEDYSILVKRISIFDAVFEDFNLYPNPSTGEFTLNLKVENTNEVLVQLYDVNGRLIDQKQFLNTIENFSKKILFNTITPGLYLLKISNGNKHTTRKIIIQ